MIAQSDPGKNQFPQNNWRVERSQFAFGGGGGGPPLIRIPVFVGIR
jgi:hypothetical protein